MKEKSFLFKKTPVIQENCFFLWDDNAIHQGVAYADHKKIYPENHH